MPSLYAYIISPHDVTTKQTNNNNNTVIMNANALIAKSANKKRAAKKPPRSREAGAYGAGDQCVYSGPKAYGLWTFPASAEAAAAFFAPPPHPLLAAVPRPRHAAQPLAAE